MSLSSPIWLQIPGLVKLKGHYVAIPLSLQGTNLNSRGLSLARPTVRGRFRANPEWG